METLLTVRAKLRAVFGDGRGQFFTSCVNGSESEVGMGEQGGEGNGSLQLAFERRVGRGGLGALGRGQSAGQCIMSATLVGSSGKGSQTLN